ncbi:hypothetical protein FHX74_002018 [Friedmanniella endophytica]|uniref:DinB-like domain-containing protein n=1 Tax=Microlunatus kandeliicorticis TaxID=1759536 RepID=A0A7W3P5X5_9ACTN|nr:DinB family protein [Microlunatus kandeliicorticis]MBA8794399.1 hypothetical protein [Microlunatus kandeliicorticis]
MAADRLLTSRDPASFDWSGQLAEQLSWHWETQLRPRLDGLTDLEYFWEPVPGAWNVRPEGDRFTIDWAVPPPDPAPVTTIAWRLGHLIVGVFGERNARYFGGPPIDYGHYAWDGTAAAALEALDAGYATWIAGVRALSTEELLANCREDGFDTESMAALVLHIHREVLHHGAEVALLRDLHLHGGGKPLRR